MQTLRIGMFPKDVCENFLHYAEPEQRRISQDTFIMVRFTNKYWRPPASVAQAEGIYCKVGRCRYQRISSGSSSAIALSAPQKPGDKSAKTAQVARNTMAAGTTSQVQSNSLDAGSSPENDYILAVANAGTKDEYWQLSHGRKCLLWAPKEGEQLPPISHWQMAPDWTLPKGLRFYQDRAIYHFARSCTLQIRLLLRKGMTPRKILLRDVGAIADHATKAAQELATLPAEYILERTTPESVLFLWERAALLQLLRAMQMRNFAVCRSLWSRHFGASDGADSQTARAFLTPFFWELPYWSERDQIKERALGRGNGLAYPHRTGFRPVSCRMQHSPYHSVVNSLDRNSGQRSESGPVKWSSVGRR